MKAEQIERLEALLALFDKVPYGNWADTGSGAIVAGLFADDIGVTPGWSPDARELMVGAVSFIRKEGPALLQLARAVREAPTFVAKYRSSTFLTNDPANPAQLIEKRDSWATVEAWELPPEYAGQTVALVPVPVKEGP